MVEAIKANRFWVLTNREFLDEVKRLNRELEEAFPAQDAPRGRVVFETMRAEMAENLLRAGNRPVAQETDTSAFGLDFGSTNAD